MNGQQLGHIPPERIYGIPFRVFVDQHGTVYSDLAVCEICRQRVSVGAELREHARWHQAEEW